MHIQKVTGACFQKMHLRGRKEGGSGWREKPSCDVIVIEASATPRPVRIAPLPAADALSTFRSMGCVAQGKSHLHSAALTLARSSLAAFQDSAGSARAVVGGLALVSDSSEKASHWPGLPLRQECNLEWGSPAADSSNH